VGAEPYGSALLSNYSPLQSSTLSHIDPPPRCGGLSRRPPCRVGLDRTHLARGGGLSHPPRVGLGHTPSPRHVGLVCSHLAPPWRVGLGRYHSPRRRVGLGCTRSSFPLVAEAVEVNATSLNRGEGLQ
jgi:hypothetical protein